MAKKRRSKIIMAVLRVMRPCAVRRAHAVSREWCFRTGVSSSGHLRVWPCAPNGEGFGRSAHGGDAQCMHASGAKIGARGSGTGCCTGLLLLLALLVLAVLSLVDLDIRGRSAEVEAPAGGCTQNVVEAPQAGLCRLRRIRCCGAHL
eukprot:SAG22_NODE_9861_length_565_cov_2.375536_1_plen_146_part_10